MYEFESGDGLVARVLGSVGTPTRADVTVKYDDGTSDIWHIVVTSAGARTVELFRPGEGDVFLKAGRVTSLAVDVLGVTKRGQYYIHLFIERRDVTRLMSLAAFYATSMFFGGLGYFEDPLNGRGYNHMLTLASDEAGDTDTVVSMAASNTLRLWRGLVIYYEASDDVATRSLFTTLRKVGGALPTGFTESVNNYVTGTIAIAADQELNLYIGQNTMFVSENDDTTLTYNANDTVPNPFPMLLTEDDLAEFVISITNGHANDRYSAYGFLEEWLEE